MFNRLVKVVDLFKPYECEAYDGVVSFKSHKTWTREGAFKWAHMYNRCFTVVIWRAASFNRLPKIEGIRYENLYH